MNKTLLIFKHEFSHTLRRTGFIILTLALPVLALLAIGIFHLVSGVSKPQAEVSKIGYVDNAGGFSQFTSQGSILLVSFLNQETAGQALLNKTIQEYFVIPSDYPVSGQIVRYTTQKELYPPEASTAAIKSFLTNNLLSGKVPDATANVIEQPLNVITVRLTSTGSISLEQGGFGDFIVPAIFALLLALSLIFSSTYVLQGLGEEKENRLMEILLSSVSTQQLITGKVLGIGAAGLVQVLVWVATAPLLVKLASSSIGGLLSTVHVSASFLVLGVVYFILGYLLFAILSAGVAAVSSTVREGQGIAGIFSMFAVAPFWFVSVLLIFPNSPIWIVFSIFPFSAPVMVMLRLGLTGVPVWQIAAGITVLVLSLAGGLWLTARLLRVYMLMYGKRPAMREIVRNLRAG